MFSLHRLSSPLITACSSAHDACMAHAGLDISGALMHACMHACQLHHRCEIFSALFTDVHAVIIFKTIHQRPYIQYTACTTQRRGMHQWRIQGEGIGGQFPPRVAR